MVMGNWKMNGRKESVTALLHDLLALLPKHIKAECVIFPPAIYLPLVQQFLMNSSIQIGGQNVYPEKSGAFTGELSAEMLADYGCRYVLVGHSERRQLFHEDEKFVSEKFHHVKDHDMIPVLCVGETLKERKQGLTEEILTQQLLAVYKEDRETFRNCVVAYEPVWAIGTGQTASPEQAQEVHAFIRNLVATVDEPSAHQLPIVYGGSVSEKNARSLLAMSDIDGGLVGGASLSAQQFVEILKCIN
jgi:triosephosphate isomerase